MKIYKTIPFDRAGIEGELIESYRLRSPEKLDHHISNIRVLSDQQLYDVYCLIVRDVHYPDSRSNREPSLEIMEI